MEFVADSSELVGVNRGPEDCAFLNIEGGSGQDDDIVRGSRDERSGGDHDRGVGGEVQFACNGDRGFAGVVHTGAGIDGDAAVQGVGAEGLGLAAGDVEVCAFGEGRDTGREIGKRVLVDEQGFAVSGVAELDLGIGVVGVDVDVLDLALQDDSREAAGFFAVVSEERVDRVFAFRDCNRDLFDGIEAEESAFGAAFDLVGHLDDDLAGSVIGGLVDRDRGNVGAHA